MSSDLIVKSVLILGMLITGSINTLTKKIQNDCESVGINGRKGTFDHPWFQTAVMFSGEFICLLVFGLLQLRQKPARRTVPTINIDETDALLKAKAQNTNSLTESLLFVIPTCLDVLGSSLAGIGLLWVSASVWQMMRGTIIIFSGILSAIFLKRKLHAYRWFGMLVTASGLGVVGISSFVGSHKSAGNTKLLGLGLLFIIAGQFFNAVQMVVEEKLLKDRSFPPLQIVGMEGLWGLIIMSAVILPIMYFIPGSNAGSYENSLDAFAMIKHNHVLLIMTILYIISIAFYNFCGLAVTKKLTAVHRTLIDALRTICVWGMSLTLYYVTPNHSYGEPWSDHSWIQVVGFALLMLGTLIYNAVIRIPGLYYEQKSGYVPIPDKSTRDEEESNSNTA